MTEAGQLSVQQSHTEGSNQRGEQAELPMVTPASNILEDTWKHREPL